MQEKLFKKDYVLICMANFMLFYGFYAIMTILPFYMLDVCKAKESVIGIALSSMSIAAVCSRPISGYVYDIHHRKPIYVFAYFSFAVICLGYVWSSIISVIIILRILQGITFGTATVGGYAIVADIIPKKRIGEGIGYYGLANTIAMCFAPMITLWMLDKSLSYNSVMTISILVSTLGACSTLLISVPQRNQNNITHKLSFDNLFVKRGIIPAVCFMLVAIAYGMTTGYIALYTQEIGYPSLGGMFFVAMAIGLGGTRAIGGNLCDKLHPTTLIKYAIVMSIITYSIIAAYPLLSKVSTLFMFCYVISALLVGIVFGTLHPAMNKLLLTLASPEQRGAASSTYLTSFDSGIAIGMLLGGIIASYSNTYCYSYLTGALMSVVGLIFFFRWTLKTSFGQKEELFN